MHGCRWLSSQIQRARFEFDHRPRYIDMRKPTVRRERLPQLPMDRPLPQRIQDYVSWR